MSNQSSFQDTLGFISVSQGINSSMEKAQELMQEFHNSPGQLEYNHSCGVSVSALVFTGLE